MPNPEIRIAELFAYLAKGKRVLEREDFHRMTKSKDAFWNDRLFDIINVRHDGKITEQEFIKQFKRIYSEDENERIRFIFDLYDLNADGIIERHEVETLMRSSLKDNGIAFTERDLQTLVEYCFYEGDKNRDGRITIEEFGNILATRKLNTTDMTVGFLKVSGKKDPGLSSAFKQRMRNACEKGWNLLVHNKHRILLMLIYVTANIFLFSEAVHRYSESGANGYVQIARGCGAMMNFNGALILFPMLRHLITYIRKSTLGNILRVDDSVSFHKIVGTVLFASAIVHTVTHILNYTCLKDGVVENLFMTKAGLTGFLVMLVFVGMWVTSLPFIRKGGKFKVFFVFHQLYWTWFVLVLLHGPNFWMWAAIPILGFVVELFYRMYLSNKECEVVNARNLPSGVLGLYFKKPVDFRYQPGDYLFLQFPQISDYEWHPFTISSAPEMEHMSVHIRSVGSWTKRINQYFAARNEAEHVLLADAVLAREMVFIDGPYGTPSTDIFNAECAVLIAGGIGVTPFASILQSIIAKKKSGQLKRLKKIHFHWVAADQHSFEWFIALLSRIEMEMESDDFFEIHLYLTSMAGEQEVKSLILHTSLGIFYDESGVDFVTGLSTRTNASRPNWKVIFQNLEEKWGHLHPEVFFCGPRPLANELKDYCAKHGFRFKKENF